MGLFNGATVPKKPTKQKEQIDMMWQAVYNHLPTKIKWIDVKANFILALVALILALQGVLIVTLVIS